MHKKITLLCLLLASPAFAFTGKVVGVADGDTLTVLADRQQIKVRLVEIDAPEKAQAWGNRSKQSLSDLCFGKVAAGRGLWGEANPVPPGKWRHRMQ